MTADQRVLYDNAGEVRNTDVTLRWSIAGIFLTLHSVGLTFVATQVMAGRSIFLGVYVGGALLGLVWIFLNTRMQQWVSYWNSRVEILEEMADSQTVRVFGGDEFHRLLAYGASTYNILRWLSGGVFLLWWALFEFFLFTP